MKQEYLFKHVYPLNIMFRRNKNLNYNFSYMLIIGKISSYY